VENSIFLPNKTKKTNKNEGYNFFLKYKQTLINLWEQYDKLFVSKLPSQSSRKQVSIFALHLFILVPSELWFF